MKGNRRRSGQALVEFALVLPLILLLIIAFIELARIFYFYSALNNAVREGARYAVVNQFADTTERELEVRQTVAHFAVALSLNPADVSIYCDRDESDLNNPCDEYVTVSADIEIEPMVGFFAQIIGAGNTYNITAASTMQMTPYGMYEE